MASTSEQTGAQGSVVDVSALGRNGAWLKRGLALVPLLFAVPVVIAVIVNTVHLAGSTPLSFDTSQIDGTAFYAGEGLFNNPATGYTANSYTPLVPFVVGLVDHLHLWTGWAAAMAFAGSIALLGLAAALAFRPTGPVRWDRWLGVAEAVGIGALIWTLISGQYLDYFSRDRPDQVAWAFALFGVVAVPLAIRRPGTVRWALAIGFLTAGFWSKQTTLVASVAAIGWLVIAVVARWTTVRGAALFAAILLGVNLAILGLLNLLTGGWEWYTNFSQPGNTPCCELGHTLPGILKGDMKEFLAYGVFVLAFCLAIWLALGVFALVRARAGHSEAETSAARSSPWMSMDELRGAAGRWSLHTQVAVALLVFIVIGWFSGAYGRSNLGAANNQWLGEIWAIGLFGALGYRFLRSSLVSGVVAATFVLGVFLAIQTIAPTTLLGRKLPVPALGARIDWDAPKPKPELTAYAQDHVVYSDYPNIIGKSARIGAVYPNRQNVGGILAAGREPTWLANAILNRRFDAITGPFIKVNHPLNSGAGRYEENYLWKLNEAILAKYQVSDVGGGLYVRRPGPDPAPSMQRCFGPFTVAGIPLQQHWGGGFWCPSGSGIALRDTPAAVSSLRSRRTYQRVSGSISVQLPHGTGGFEIYLSDANGKLVWTVRGIVTGRRLQVTALNGKAASQPVTSSVRHDRPARLAIAFGGSSNPSAPSLQQTGGRAVTATVASGPPGSQFNLAASRGSGAEFDLGGVRLS